jgi:hypothetical protein
MNVAFWFSYAVLWIIVIMLSLLVLLLYRQFGLTYMSGQRRINMQGLDVGARAPSFSLLSVACYSNVMCPTRRVNDISDRKLGKGDANENNAKY